MAKGSWERERGGGGGGLVVVVGDLRPGGDARRKEARNALRLERRDALAEESGGRATRG